MNFDKWMAEKLGKAQVETKGYSTDDMARFIGEYLQEVKGISAADWNYDCQTQTLKVPRDLPCADYIKGICDKFLIYFTQ